MLALHALHTLSGVSVLCLKVPWNHERWGFAELLAQKKFHFGQAAARRLRGLPHCMGHPWTASSRDISQCLLLQLPGYGSRHLETIAVKTITLIQAALLK